MPPAATTVLVVDDHPLFRRGVRQLLEMDDGLRCVGEAPDGATALELAARLRPDMVLLDLRMAVLSGLETLRAFRDKGLDTRIVVLTVSDGDDDVVAALRAGADGYLLKDMEPEDLLQRLREAAAGELVLSERLTRTLAQAVAAPGKKKAEDRLERLTAREREILATLARGLSNKAIARELDLSEGTVKVHVKRVLRKLELRSRVEAAVWAVNAGLH